MEVIIHIGDAKCGSSSIQGSLAQRREELLEKGILYHPATLSNGHYSYITLLNGRTRGDNEKQRMMANANVAATKELIAEHRPKYLLLSSENFFTLVPDRLLALIDEICGGPCPINIAAFVRHPVSFYLSTVQQILKADHEFTPPQSFSRNTALPLQRWKAHTRCKSMQVKLFDRRRLKENSVIAEFEDMLRSVTGNITVSLPEVNKNNSLSAEQIVVLQQFRGDSLSDSRGKFERSSNALLRLFFDLNALTESSVGSRPELSEIVENCVLEKNESSITEIDALFPEIEMARSRRGNSGFHMPDPVPWNREVASILKNVDEDVIRDLRQLIPAYNLDLSVGEFDQALEAISRLCSNPDATKAFIAYLKRCDIHYPLAGISAHADLIRPANILILGTSNSLLKNGWTKGFNEALAGSAKITNRSLGGSPSSQFAMLCDTDFAEYDCVIFDAVVNDENMMSRSYLGTLDHHSRLLFEIMSTIASQTKLVVLGFCNERFVTERTEIYKLHRDTAHRLGAEFYSVIDFATRHPKPWFHDPAHIAMNIAESFGTLLAKKFLSGIPSQKSAENFSDRFYTINVRDIADGEFVEKSTALLKLDFLRMQEGQTLDFDAPGALIGVLLDSEGTYGFLKFTGIADTLYKSVRFAKTEKKALVYYIAIANGIRTNSLTLVANAKNFVRSEHEVPSRDREDCELLISALSFWNRR